MKNLAIKLIELYEIMPLRMHKSCRFIPTCSVYTKESIRRFGFIKGSILGIKRIIKCHPFGKYGYDPVKEKL